MSKVKCFHSFLTAYVQARRMPLLPSVFDEHQAKYTVTVTVLLGYNDNQILALASDIRGL